MGKEKNVFGPTGTLAVGRETNPAETAAFFTSVNASYRNYTRQSSG